MCAYVNDHGSELSMNEEIKNNILEANSVFANLGRRVLAFSY